MKKQTLIVLIFLFIGFFGIFMHICSKNNFDVRIEAKFDNMSSKEIDSTFAEEIKDKLMQIRELKRVVIFSRQNKCTIYCKINPFYFNRRQIIEKIEKKLNFALNKTAASPEIYFDDEFNLKYDKFLIISSKTASYNDLKEYSDKILDDLLGLKISSAILAAGEQEKTIYLNFNDSILTTFDFTLAEIKDIIKNNNIIQNSSIKTNEKISYPIAINGAIKSVKDLKNIAVIYKDKGFSTKLSEIFEITEGTKEPADYFVNFNGKKAQIFAISKKKFYPGVLFDIKLKNYIKNREKNEENFTLNLINTSFLEKTEIHLDNRASVYNTLDLSRKTEKNFDGESGKRIYFIGHDIPKISRNETFFENEKNKLTILSDRLEAKKIRLFLKEEGLNYFHKNDTKIIIKDKNLENLRKKTEKILEILNGDEKISKISTEATRKTTGIYYEIGDWTLNDNGISRAEVLDTIFAINDGLFCDYFYEDTKRVPIILSNKNNLERGYVYAKSTKALIYLESIAKSRLKEIFSVIARENENYFSRINISFEGKNPFREIILKQKIKNALKKPL